MPNTDVVIYFHTWNSRFDPDEKLRGEVRSSGRCVIDTGWARAALCSNDPPLAPTHLRDGNTLH